MCFRWSVALKKSCASALKCNAMVQCGREVKLALPFSSVTTFVTIFGQNLRKSPSLNKLITIKSLLHHFFMFSSDEASPSLGNSSKRRSKISQLPSSSVNQSVFEGDINYISQSFPHSTTCPTDHKVKYKKKSCSFQLCRCQNGTVAF